MTITLPSLLTKRVAAAIAMAGALAVVACGPAATPTPDPGPDPGGETPVATPTPLPSNGETPTPAVSNGDEPQQGGIIRRRIQRDTSSFDPHNATSSRDNVTNAHLYSPIMIDNNGDELTCNLCTEIEYQDDGQTAVIHLVDNATFADGSTMTSADVKYSLGKMMGLEDGIVSARVGWLGEYVDFEATEDGTGIEAPDDQTVILHLVRPAAVLPTILANPFGGIVKDGATREGLQNFPNGTGPWMLESEDDWVSGSRMDLKPNPNYHVEGRPYPDEWRLVVIGDAIAASSAFLTDNVDIHRESEIPPDDLTVYRERADAGEIGFVEVPSGCRPQGINMNSTQPPFDNPDLRRAVNLAVDREGYLEAVHDGNAVPSLVFAPDGASGRSEEDIWAQPGWATGDAKEAEREEARQLVADAGYEDGLDLEMTVRSSGQYPRQAEFLAAQLSEIGINVDLTLMDSPELFPRVEELNYTIWPYWFCQTTGDADEMLGSYFVTGGSRNWLGYSSDELDTLFAEQSQELDPVRRTEMIREAEDLILEDMPFAPTADHFTWHAWSNNIENWSEGIFGFYYMEAQDNTWVRQD